MVRFKGWTRQNSVRIGSQGRVRREGVRGMRSRFWLSHLTGPLAVRLLELNNIGECWKRREREDKEFSCSNVDLRSLRSIHNKRVRNIWIAAGEEVDKEGK